MNKQIRKYSILAAAVSSATLAVTSPVQAQQAEGTALEEVLVTASRREQNLQDVPAAVAVLSPDDFKFQGLQQVSDLFDYTPGVNFDDDGQVGRGSISARGVPQSLGIPVFGAYLDDTPLTVNTNFGGSGVFLDGLLMDLERIEVIKGPQGTLYGATSVGGMMRYISKKPTLDEVRGSVSVDLNDIAEGDTGNTVTGALSVPLVKDTLGLTISGYRQDRAGYVDYVDAATGELIEKDVDQADNEGVSADLLFRATDSLDLRLNYIKQEVTSRIASTVQLAGVGLDSALFDDFTTINRPGAQSLEYEVMSGTVNYEFSFATLTFNSSYVQLEVATAADQTAALGPLVDLVSGQAPGTTTAVDVVAGNGSEKYVQELRLTSTGDGNLEWIAGLYYAQEDTFNFQAVATTPVAPIEIFDASFPSEYEELAAFGNLTYALSDKLDLTAGVRASDVETTLTFVTSGVLVGEGSVSGQKVNDTVYTYLFAASYQPYDNLSLYARAASGYRPAGTNLPVVNPVTGENIAPPIIEADDVWSYEVGAKGRSDNGLFQYDLALWTLEWDNFQTLIFANGVNTGSNATDGISATGLEGEFSINPLENLSVIANFAYTDSTLNSDEPAFGGVGGEQVPGLPEWTASLRWNYGFGFAGAWQGVFSGGVRFIGENESAYGNSPSVERITVDSRTITDMNLSAMYKNYTIGLYATNLFDEQALNDRLDQNAGAGIFNSTGTFQRPRTIGINFRYDL